MSIHARPLTMFVTAEEATSEHGGVGYQGVLRLNSREIYRTRTIVYEAEQALSDVEWDVAQALGRIFP